MALNNEFQIKIDGYAVKELRCKNDACRKLIGYESIKLGVFIFKCANCGFISIFNMRYDEVGKAFIEKLQKQFPKGGEK